jgi:hypothetical protein
VPVDVISGARRNAETMHGGVQRRRREPPVMKGLQKMAGVSRGADLRLES